MADSWTPPELDEGTLKTILEGVGRGHRAKTAAAAAGVHPDDFDTWLERGQNDYMEGDRGLYAQLYRMIPLVDGQGLAYWEGEYLRAVRGKEGVYAQNCLIVLKARWPEIWEKGPKETGGEDRFEDEIAEFMRKAKESDPKPIED